MADRTWHLADGRCADLVLDLLPADERRHALDHASGCAACAERLRAHVAASVRMRVDMPGAGSVRPHRMPRRWGLAPGIAAAGALALWLGWPRGGQQPGLSATHWLTRPSTSVLL